MTKGVQTTLAVCLLIVSIKILRFVFQILKQRSALKKLDGFQGTGHWFRGHTSEIRKIEKVNLLKNFPCYFKFSEGFFRYRICCYDPGLIRHVIHNSDKATERFSVPWLTYRGNNCIENKLIGPELKAYKLLLHKCYVLHPQQHFIKICREVCMSSLENINTSDQEVKTMDIRSFLSGIEYTLPIKLWMGETTIEFKKLVSILVFEDDGHRKPDYYSIFDYWQTACETLKAFSRHKRIDQIHRKVLAIHRNMMLNSLNRETVCHRTCILDQVIHLEMTVNHNMSHEDYTCLFLTHLSMVNSIRRLFFWIIKSLAENTTWQDRICREIIQMKQNGKYSVGNLQLESFQDLNMFVCECLRMYPTQMTTRKVTESFIFDGHVIPVGTLIDIDLFSLHRNPLFWDLPGKFMPERFLQGSGKHAYQYLPFSAGQRNCPAEKFIHTVIKTAIITFVERVKIKIVNKVNNANEVMNGTYIEVTPHSV